MAVGIDIDQFKRFTEYIAKKSGKGNYASPSQFNMLVNQALMEFISKYNGDPADYQPGRPIPKISYENTMTVAETLRYIKESREFVVSDDRIGIPDGSTVKDKNGAVCPEALHIKSLRHYFYKQEKDKNGDYQTTKKEFSIEVVRDSEIGDRLVSEINIPTQRFPICELESTKLRFYPSNIQYIKMVYLRMPKTAVWNYDDANGRPVYKSSGSVDIEAPKDCFNEIAAMYLSYLGINMRDMELVNYAEMAKQKGI